MKKVLLLGRSRTALSALDSLASQFQIVGLCDLDTAARRMTTLHCALRNSALPCSPT